MVPILAEQQPHEVRQRLAQPLRQRLENIFRKVQRSVGTRTHACTQPRTHAHTHARTHAHAYALCVHTNTHAHSCTHMRCAIDSSATGTDVIAFDAMQISPTNNSRARLPRQKAPKIERERAPLSVVDRPGGVHTDRPLVGLPRIQCNEVVQRSCAPMRAGGTRSSFETIGSACTRVHTIDYANGNWIGGLL